jgi:hypothetical protein
MIPVGQAHNCIVEDDIVPMNPNRLCRHHNYLHVAIRKKLPLLLFNHF